MSLHIYGDGVLRTHVTLDDVAEVIEEQHGTHIEFGPNIKVTDIGKGNGWQSKIALIDLNSEDVQNFPERFVLKINSQLPLAEISTDVWDFKAFEGRLRQTHNRELDVYDLIKRYGGPSLRSAQVFASKRYSDQNINKGFLVMQHFSDIHTIHLIDQLEVKCVREILRSLAAFHVIGLKMNAEERKMFNYDVFNSFFGGFWTEASIERCLGIACAFVGKSAEKKIARLKTLMPMVASKDALSALNNSSTRRGMSPVLCHGDLWGPNMLFTKKKGPLEMLAFVDFQTTHLGNPAVDMAVLLCTQLSVANRKAHEYSLIEDYYGFVRALVDGEMPFTLDQLNESYDEFIPFGIYFTVDNLGGTYDGLKETHPEKEMPTRQSVVEKLDNVLDELISILEHRSDDK